MIKRSIRYHYVVLLCFAALALVTNPVLHALGHNHVESPGDLVEHLSNPYWAADTLCPYCDAVSQHIAPPHGAYAIAPVISFNDHHQGPDLYADLRLLHSKRLRAPPF